MEGGGPELYDLQRDAAESSNKYEPAGAQVQEARAMLAEVRAGEGMVEASNPSSLPDPKDKIDEQNLLHAAMIASDDDRPADARKALEKVLALDPKSPTALRQLGELQLQAGDYVQAAQHLKSEVQVRPDDA